MGNRFFIIDTAINAISRQTCNLHVAFGAPSHQLLNLVLLDSILQFILYCMEFMIPPFKPE